MTATLPVCGRVLDDIECHEVGAHFCEPRAQHVVRFFSELLFHTIGTYQRKRFIPTAWQRDEILRPIFGEVEWSEEHQAYRRRYRVAYIELSRKNGKSALLAGCMLYLLFADGEYSAELYGIARNRKQASLIFDMAAQMVLMNPLLSKRAKVIKSTKRIVKLDTNSVYQVLAADAASALGSNPSAVAADEILAWRDNSMWTAMRSGMGSKARLQPLLIAATTAGSDTESFGGMMHTEMVRVLEDPERSPHVFAFIRNMPREADVWDEKNWYWPNPALGDFLSLEEMRTMANEAKLDPTKENGFRQFQANQHVSSAVRWMQMHLYDASAGTLYPNAEAARVRFTGRDCWIGIDLAARQDLCAIAYLFPGDDGYADLLWRFWLPEAAFDRLDKAHSGRLSEWASAGWLQVTEGDVLDFRQVYDDIEDDARRFSILGGDADKWSSDPVIQEISQRTYIQDIMAYENNMRYMSVSMHRTMEMVKEKKFAHHGNPVARWCFDACEARVGKMDPDQIRPDKPSREKTARRIDAVPAAIMAINAWTIRGGDVESVYANEDVMVVDF